MPEPETGVRPEKKVQLLTSAESVPLLSFFKKSTVTPFRKNQEPAYRILQEYRYYKSSTIEYHLLYRVATAIHLSGNSVQ